MPVFNLQKAIEQLPVNKMHSQLHYLQNVLLPQIEKKLGTAHETYIFYQNIIKTISWAIVLHQQMETLKRRISWAEYKHSILLKENEELLDQLGKYTTIEEVYTLLATHHINEAAAQSAANNIINTPKL